MLKETDQENVRAFLRGVCQEMSQKALAKKTRYNEAQLSQMMNGHRVISLRFVMALHETLGESVDFILGHAPSKEVSIGQIAGYDVAELKAMERAPEISPCTWHAVRTASIDARLNRVDVDLIVAFAKSLNAAISGNSK